jgi:hypothetical protein
VCRSRWRDRGDEVTYTRGDRGTCCGQGWGFGPSAPSVRRTAGMATAEDGAAATATETGRAASPENLAPPRRPEQTDPARDQTIGEVSWGRGGPRVGMSDGVAAAAPRHQGDEDGRARVPHSRNIPSGMLA